MKTQSLSQGLTGKDRMGIFFARYDFFAMLGRFPPNSPATFKGVKSMSLHEG